MSIVNTTECIICYNEYDTETRKPCIGTCGHSICEGCKHQMVSSKCPQCNREEAFAITTINYQVLELIKHFKSMQAGTAQNPPQKLFNEETKGLDEGICSECSLRSRKLRICVTCALEQKVLKKDRGDIVLNVIDDKIEEAIQKAKGIAICGDCALDGERHEGHKTKLLATLKNSLDDMLVNTVELKLKTMDDSAAETCKSLYNRFGDGRRTKLLTKLRDGSGDMAVGEIEQKITKMKDDMTKAQKEWKTRFQLCTESLKSLLETCRSLSGEIKLSHLEGTIDNMIKLANTMDIAEQSVVRLETIAAKLQELKKFVEDNNKAFPTTSRVHPTDHPVLVANQKNNSQEPLLIGVFNPKTTTWQPVGRMPNPKSNYAVASNKSQIYIVGGMNNGSWLNTLEMYDKDKNLRRDCANLKHRRARAAAGFHDHKLYVAGGQRKLHCMRSVEVYEPTINEWKNGPSLQKARANAVMVSCNGELYVLGGFNGNDYVEPIEKLSETSEGPKFELIGDMQGSRAGFGACAFKERIYVAGGWNNVGSNANGSTLKSVRSFDPMTKKWRDEPSMLRKRKYFTLHATNEAIYAIRGCTDNWKLINDVERLDPKTRKWQILESVQAITASTSADLSRN